MPATRPRDFQPSRCYSRVAPHRAATSTGPIARRDRREEIPSASRRILLANRVTRNQQPWLCSKETASSNFNSSIIPHCPVTRYYLCNRALVVPSASELMDEPLFRLGIKPEEMESVSAAYLVSLARTGQTILRVAARTRRRRGSGRSAGMPRLGDAARR